MKKTLIFAISSIVMLICLLASCNNQKSLQERLQEEKRAISRYIDREELVIVEDYPKNGVFKEKEFYKIQSEYGVMYMHVVDSGNGRRATALRDEVTLRFDYRHDIAVSDSSKRYWSQSGLINPYSFKYGLSQSYSSSTSLVCIGWVLPLSYVGERAIVDLLIPSAIGSYSDNNSINPVFYKNITYTNFY